MLDSFYSDSHRRLQDDSDSRRIADRLVETRLHQDLDDNDREIIGGLPFFFLATIGANGVPDCSIKGGDPGFVSVDGPRRLSFPNYDGNGMFRSFGNVLDNPAVALLFVEFWGKQRKLRVHGNASVERRPAENGGRRPHLRMRIDITAIYPNCPRYLPELQMAAPSVYNPRAGHVPPEPHWKSKPDLKDYLPEPG